MDSLFFLIAEYANVSTGGKLNVMGIFNTLFAARFPARHPSLHIVAKLSSGAAEANVSKRLKIKLLNDDGTEIWATPELPLKVPASVNGRRVENNVIVALTDLVFPTDGDYQFSLLVDDDEKDVAPLYVVNRPATG